MQLLEKLKLTNELKECSEKLINDNLPDEERLKLRNRKKELRILLGIDALPESASVLASRTAKTFDETREIVSEFLGEPLVNKNTGMVATISKRSLDKLLSGKAHTKSTNLDEHLLAVAHIDYLFVNSVLGWVEPDKNNDSNIAGVYKLFASLYIGGVMRLTKITIKAMQFNQGNRIYSVETIEIDN